MDLGLRHQLRRQQSIDLLGRDVFAHRAAITDPAGQPRMVISLQGLCLLSDLRLPLNIGSPAPRLEPVVRKADLGAGETRATGGIGLDRLPQVLRPDPFLHGLFDLGKAGRFSAQSVGWIGC